MRDSHTLTRFHGINTIDGPQNVKPQYALDARNCVGTPDGNLWQLRQTRTLADLGQSGAGPITSLGVLDSHAQTQYPARVVVQQGAQLGFADAPDYAAITPYTGPALPAVPGRFDYAQINSTLYFSSGAYSGKVLPGEGTTRPAGIPQSPAPAAILSTATLAVVALQRTGGIVTVQFAAPHGHFPAQPVYVDDGAGTSWDPSFSGLFPIATVPNATTITYTQPGLPDSGPFARATYPPGLTATVGYQYRGSWGDGTGGWGTASAPGPVTGPLTSQSPVLLSPVPPDPSYTAYALFRNLNNGGDWFLVNTYAVQPAGSPFAGQAVMLDTTPDQTLEQSGQTPPYDNGVMPHAKYLAVHLDRMAACGVPGDEKSVYYSGYDSINFGRPADCWPRFNRIRVGNGSVTPVGIGVTSYGFCIFGDNKSLYPVRGTLVDITTSAVTPLSFKVDERPYQVGLYSHFSIQNTPVGIVFLDDSLNLQIFDGYNAPQQAAPVLAKILSRITPNTRDLIESAYLSWADRSWYLLSVCVDGAVRPNLTVILDVNTDDVRSSGAWVSDHCIDAIVSVLNPDKTKALVCGQSQPSPATASVGVLSSFPYLFDPADLNLMPNAYYRGGYIGIKDEDGIDEWSYIKLFRFIRLMYAGDMALTAYLVDSGGAGGYTFDNPLILPFDELDSVFSVNWKSRALSPLYQFPDQGPGIPLQGVTFNWQFSGKR